MGESVEKPTARGNIASKRESKYSKKNSVRKNKIEDKPREEKR